MNTYTTLQYLQYYMFVIYNVTPTLLSYYWPNYTHALVTYLAPGYLREAELEKSIIRKLTIQWQFSVVYILYFVFLDYWLDVREVGLMWSN